MGGAAARSRTIVDGAAGARASTRSWPRSRERYPDRSLATTYPVEFPLVVDRERARFSAWYELFPRSCARHAGAARHVARLRGPAALRRGDGLRRALPAADPPDRARAPQGPQQHARRRRRATSAARGRSAPPRAATRRSAPAARHARGFRALVARARARTGSRSRWTSPSSARPTIRTCRAHPTWFRRRPDGSVQYAENPPKKYQDIYPFDFESDDWRAVAGARRACSSSGSARACASSASTTRTPSRSRSGNGRSARIKREHPDVIFLAEAFTRPQGDAPAGQARLHPVVHLLHLAQHQARADRVLHRADARAGPRLFPAQLLAQHAGHPARVPAVRRARRRSWSRLVLAATLAANYGIYGPAFELLEARPREPGREEYLDSEKYQLRALGPRARRQPGRLHRAASTRRGATTRRCSSDDGLRFFPSTTTS